MFRSFAKTTQIQESSLSAADSLDPMCRPPTVSEKRTRASSLLIEVPVGLTTISDSLGVQGLQAGSARESRGQQYWCRWRRRGWGQRRVVHGRCIGMRGLTLSKSCPELKELYSNVGYKLLDRESELFKCSDLANFSLSVHHGLRDPSLPPQLWTMLTRCSTLTELTLTSFSAFVHLFDLSPLPVARFRPHLPHPWHLRLLAAVRPRHAPRGAFPRVSHRTR
ncbi:hypothetical protein B0H11DRAFT_203261 [Mycena galericulata]|nr:hypothetical protein B0H11DRAFT_203261 [Mycena galericulata]